MQLYSVKDISPNVIQSEQHFSLNWNNFLLCQVCRFQKIYIRKNVAEKAQIFVVQRLKKFSISSKSSSYFKADLGVYIYRNKCFSFELLGDEISCAAASNYSNLCRKWHRYYLLMTGKLWSTVSINLVPTPETAGVLCAWKVIHVSGFKPKLLYNIKTIAGSLDRLLAVVAGFCNCPPVSWHCRGAVPCYFFPLPKHYVSECRIRN